MAALPRLSACVITRNEAANITRCLTSIAPVVQEMIVVDTGSADATVTLAQQAGATVSSLAWNDDFSAARNAALDRATGDWILWLDADEELLPESQPLLPKLIARANAQAYMVLRQEVEAEEQTWGFVESYMPRLWRNDPALRFTGRCHPHFGSLLEARTQRTGQQTWNCSLRLRHYGYLAPLLPGKLARAARLLQLELAERPGQIYYETELGRTWRRLGDPRGAALLAHILDRLLAMHDAPLPPANVVAPLLEACIRSSDAHSARGQQAMCLAERWFPVCPPLLSAIGEAWYRAGDYTQALAYLMQLARCAESGQYNRCTPFTRSILWGEAPLLNLAACYHRLARLDEAEYCYHRLLQRFPEHAGTRQNLALLREQRQLE